MNIIQLILVAIRGVSVLTNNPALGGGSNLKVQEASELLAMLGELLERGDEAHTELKEFTEVIQKMAEGNRAPTPTEWQTLRDRSDAAHDTIQKAAEAAAKPEPEPEPRGTRSCSRVEDPRIHQCCDKYNGDRNFSVPEARSLERYSKHQLRRGSRAGENPSVPTFL